MSEQTPNTQPLPEDLNEFSQLKAQVASDGSRRIYGVDAETGKQQQIKADDVLSAYGYSLDEAGTAQSPEASQTVTPTKIEISQTDTEVSHDLRPVKEGELEGQDKRGVSVGEGDNQDILPFGSMAHEPWTLDTDEDSEQPGPGNPNQEEPGVGEEGNPEPDEGNPGTGENQEEDPEGPKDPEDPGSPSEVDDEDSEEVEPAVPGEEAIQEELSSPELEKAETKVQQARTELARLKAGRESATFFSIKYSKKKIEAAEKAYADAKTEAGAIAVELLRGQEIKGEQLVSMINKGALDEALSLINEQYSIEMEASEGRALQKFYSWWQQQGTKLFSFGTVKKGAVMATVGIPIGIGAAIVAAPVIAGAGAAGAVGAAVASRISKGMVGNTIRRNAEAVNVAEGKKQYRTEEAQQLFNLFEEEREKVATELEELAELKNYQVDLEDHFNSDASQQTKDVKRSNDKRAAISAATAAGGALVGVAAVELSPRIADWATDRFSRPSTAQSPASYDDAGADRMRGILTQRPDAEEDWENLAETLPQGAVDPVAEQVDELYENVKDTLSSDQNKVLNQAIGRLSATEGYGNAWTVQHMDELARLAREGNSLDDIITKV